MADERRDFGPNVRTVADATTALEAASSSVTNRLSVDHAVFAEARKLYRSGDGPGPRRARDRAGEDSGASGQPRRAQAGSGSGLEPDRDLEGPTHPGVEPDTHRGRGRMSVAESHTIRRNVDPHVTVSMPVVSDKGGHSPLLAKVQKPPEVSLTQHSLPEGSVLDPRLILVAAPDSERAARFRILRHHLMEHGRPQVVVVSSSKQGEGKTTCAVNLALALAECGRARVLLVEASVRRPQLASIFRFVPPWCFAEQLNAHRHQPLLPWGVVEIADMWLHVAAIDPQTEQRQLLDAPAFSIAMERLRLANYDHIVIDAPAVVGSAEVNLIQDAADGVLLTALAKKTTARTLRSAVEQLSPSKILGTVLMEF